MGLTSLCPSLTISALHCPFLCPPALISPSLLPFSSSLPPRRQQQVRPSVRPSPVRFLSGAPPIFSNSSPFPPSLSHSPKSQLRGEVEIGPRLLRESPPPSSPPPLLPPKTSEEGLLPLSPLSSFLPPTRDRARDRRKRGGKEGRRRPKEETSFLLPRASTVGRNFAGSQGRPIQPPKPSRRERGQEKERNFSPSPSEEDPFNTQRIKKGLATLAERGGRIFSLPLSLLLWQAKITHSLGI